jgi:hypothetical protein
MTGSLPATAPQAYDGQNIVSTHALFNLIDDAFVGAVEQHRYTLFIDEVADWVHDLSITADDYAILTEARVITIEPVTGRVLWDDELYTRGSGRYRGAWSKLRTHCKERRAYLAHDETAKQDKRVFLVYQFPVEFLRSFERVYILTHLYDGSLMSAFLQLHGIEVEKMTISEDRDRLIPYDSALEATRVAEKAHKIHVCQDPAMNAVGTKAKGTKARPLSHTWFANQTKTPHGKANLKKLGNLLYNWLRHEFKASASQVMWSTYDPQAPALSSKLATYLPKKKRVGRNVDDDGHPRHGFVPFNARASNHWRERDICAYLVNLHHNATIANWFSAKGIELSDDYFALTTMVQWVFRSAIRDGKRIDLWLPSGRMREIFRNWLAGKLPDGPSLPLREWQI